MAQRRRQRGRHSANSARNKSNLRPAPRHNYKEEKGTQSENSDDFDDNEVEEDDDSDFEPLKKYAIRAKRNEIKSKDKNFQPLAGSQKSHQISEFSLDVSKPMLSDSESSDEEVNPIEPVDKTVFKMDGLKPINERYLKAEDEGAFDMNKGNIRSDGNEDVCAAEGMPKNHWLTQPKENEMDEDATMYDASKPLYRGYNASTVETPSLNIMLTDCLVNEKAIEPIKDVTSSTTKNHNKTVSQENRKTRNSLRKHKASTSIKEQDVSTLGVGSKKLSKKSVKGVTNEKKGKKVKQNQVKFSQSLPGSSKSSAEHDNDFSDDDSDESENEWEDVHEVSLGESLHESPRKKAKLDGDVKDISINLQVKSIHKSRGGKNQDKFMQYVEKRMRKLQNEQQTNLHKCHLMCLVARLKWLNRICNEEIIKAVCASLVPVSFVKSSVAKWDMVHLKRFVNWFRTGVPDAETFLDNYGNILGDFRKLTRLQIFISILRTMGLLTRLVTSLQPITWKVENSELFRLKTNGKKEASKKKVNSKSSVKHFQDGVALKSNQKVSQPHATKKKSKNGKVTSPYFEHKVASDEVKAVEEQKWHHKKRNTLSSETKPLKRKLNIKSATKNSKDDKETKLGNKVSTPSKSAKRKRKAVNYKESGDDIYKDDASSDADPGYHDDADSVDSNADSDDEGSDFDDDFIETPKSLSAKLSQKVKKSTSKSCMPSVERGYARKLVTTIDNDEKFEKTSKPVKREKSLNTIRSSPTVKVISSDSDSSNGKDVVDEADGSLHNSDSWCEVYVESIKRWICIDISSCTVDDVKKIESQTSQPLQYIIGIDNQNAIKDVTCRYASKFMSKTRRLRIDREWWSHTLEPYETKRKKFDEEENLQLKMSLMQQPFPSTLSEFKNHPLYVLEGDLLKFEAIYPEQPAVLGYFRKKAIYSRECVHILHTRENWLKEARVVKQGENAYKIVRGRPKRSTPVHERDKVKIDLFGLWQTEIYKPPPIVDGKVPRNEYGNVELFQPSMIPPGGVHIPIQGIHKTARKLGIDAAPAMMGWDFHSGCAHPIIEGVVVAAEFEEKLLDAWQKDEDERERKLKEKNEKKILERWKMLVKGLLVRERIRRKYDFRDGEHSEFISANKEERASHVSVSWPLNKLEGTTSVNNKGHCHVFPKSSFKQDKITGEWTKSCSCGLSMPFEKL